MKKWLIFFEKMLWNIYPLIYDKALLATLPYKELLQQIKTTTQNYLLENKKKQPVVLDACCGTGNFGYEIFRDFPGMKLTGVDRSSTMIGRARQKSEGVEYEISDILDYLKNAASDNFDVIVMVNGFYPLGDKITFIEEVRRSLKSGGAIVLCDPDHGATMYAILKDHMKRGRMKDRLKLPLALPVFLTCGLLLYGIKYRLYHYSEIKNMLILNGFEIRDEKKAYANQNYLVLAVKP